MTALLTLDNVTLGYQRHPAVHHVSGALNAGEIVAVVGPNGAGKSTFLKALAGQITPLSGRLTAAPGLASAYLSQLIEFESAFPIRTDDFVALSLKAPAWPFGGGAERRAKAAAAMAQVGLAGLEDRPLATLSGGQLQRARIARLLTPAQLMLLDEPFAGLDDAVTQVILAVMRRWRDEGRAVVIVLHEVEMARTLADRVLVLARELIAWDKPALALTPEALDRAAHLRQSWDNAAAICAREQAA